MDEQLLSALSSIPVSEVPRDVWIRIGRALKEAGADVSVWDEWSQDDARYSPGECETKWAGFNGNNSPVSAGTIIQIAKEYGWTPVQNSQTRSQNFSLNWNDRIPAPSGHKHTEKTTEFAPSDGWNAADDLKKYLNTMFNEGDIVAFVTNSYQSGDKWVPGQAIFRTLKDLLVLLEKYSDDVGAVVGDWKPEAGAWICINPVDGKGSGNKNITAFRYALIECDHIPLHEQYKKYIEMQLPIACLVFSGGRSLHAIVRIDAADESEYNTRVRFLFSYLAGAGINIDQQNKNPSRLSRMPGISRNGKWQYTVDTNLGCKSWAEWVCHVSGTELPSEPININDTSVGDDEHISELSEPVSDGLPKIVSLFDFSQNLPALKPELIGGLLRQGHKMLVSGSSKAGKSYMLMELCLAFASGGEWIGFPCQQSKVLYVNLEIDKASCIHRFYEICDALNLDRTIAKRIFIWNLRGHATTFDNLLPDLISNVQGQHFNVIVLDPIYKILTGDENSASDMSRFCNLFDRVATETDCAVIYCHHHSKGAQGSKRSIDRASGSGVFGRDPDAVVDLIQLQSDNPDETAWRMETNLREFKNIEPRNFWFRYPLHIVDDTGKLDKCRAAYSPSANLNKSEKNTTVEERNKSIREAFAACSTNPPVRISDIAKYLRVSERTVRNRINDMGSEFTFNNGIVTKIA